MLSSTRRMGNTEQLAYCAANSLPSSAQQRWIHLQDHPLPYFVDLRHHTPYPAPTGNAQLLLDATLDATDLVLVAPLYWYSLPVHAKHYLDYWSAWLRTPHLNFREEMRGKTLWFIVVSSGDRAETKPLEETLILTARYMAMNWGGLLYGTGSRPNDIQDDAQALKQAQHFFSAADPAPDPSPTAAQPLMQKAR
ncbi:NAD(P)H-dependent oxidoreductase [Hymenobacter sp. 5317J-9]|uniref:flavodoxin family protein n=1 Tax=Hymenobacter sp. 5317J-9 TaxID=2932250 RepID=UPI001FD6BCAC|nr:NAD(P)H-dependent oxidoreductase [Hymenobacter sp. 5317J-9]UOQ95990.1 NAD(P)H-dependent oxidoreductase [Hymenobacter sp. 5317J-9]